MAQVKPVNKKKMSKASLAASIVSIVILLAFAISVVTSSPILVRAKSGASSDNFSINGAMMDYFAGSYIQSWYENEYVPSLQQTYGDYWQIYLQYGLIDGFDTSKPYDEQYYDKDAGITYADFFVESAGLYLEKLLKYCEAAKADTTINYSEIEAEAKAEAKETIETVEVYAKLYGMTAKDYIRSYFGINMNKKDLEKCIIIEQIAGKYSDIMYERIFDNMSDDRKTEFFKDNVGSFITAEHLIYSVSQPNSSVVFPVAEDYEGGAESKAYKAAKEAVDKANESITKEEDKQALPNVDDYVGGEASVAYKAAYEAAEELKAENELKKASDKVLMDKLAQAGSANEFKTIILEHVYSSNFDSAYNSISSKLGDTKPTDEALAEYKASVKDAIIEATVNGKTNIYELPEAKLEEMAASTDWEQRKNAFPADVIAKLQTVLTSAQATATYTLSTDLGRALFSGVKAEYGIDYKPYETEGTNAKVGDVWYVDGLVSNKNTAEYALAIYEGMLNEEDLDKATIEEAITQVKTELENRKKTLEDAEKTGSYTYVAYFVTEAAHRSEVVTRDVGHILFSVDTTGSSTTAYKTSEEAKKAAETLLETIKNDAVDGVVSKETFESHASKTHDSNVFYYDVYTEQNFASEFKDWLFAAEKVGDLGLVETQHGWHIMYYAGEGEEAEWQYLAHLGSTNEDLSDWFEALTYEVNVNTTLLEEYYK